MNRKALRYWFDEEREVEYDEQADKFLVYTDELFASDLGEISACDAGIRYSPDEEAFVVFDDAPTYL